MMLSSVACSENKLRWINLFEGDAQDSFGVSFLGGGEFVINGIGFNDAPELNQVMFTTSSVSTSEITVSGTPLTGRYSNFI